MLRIGLVANEPSADTLGAGLMRALRAQVGEVEFTGIGGPQMEAEGMRSLFPQERLAVMGLVEVLRHLPELLRIKKKVADHFLANPPDCFVGIDAPDFNFPLERQLRESGIPTVHYVCPSVWAWREGRVKTIRAACDLVLSILPFEPKFLQRHDIRATFVGHTLADEIPFELDQGAAQRRLGLEGNFPVLALLPGSRMSEIRYLAEDFIRAALLLRQRFPDLGIAVPLVNGRVRAAFEERLVRVAPDLPVHLIEGGARDVLTASDLVLAASGTATLEALLVKRPMVIAYRLHALTYRIVRGLKLVRIAHVGLPNLLAGRDLVPEFIQEQITPEALADALQGILDDPVRIKAFHVTARRIHEQMRRGADRRAARAVLRLIGRGGEDEEDKGDGGGGDSGLEHPPPRRGGRGGKGAARRSGGRRRGHS